MANLKCFTENLGFQYLYENILKNLKPQDLANCRLVSKAWNHLIDYKKSLVMLQIKHTMDIRVTKLTF